MFKPALLAVFSVSLFTMIARPVLAAPNGSNWFWLKGSPDTSAAAPDGFSYYYVGQTFYSPITISSDQTSAANIWVDYPAELESTGIFTGSYFPYWSGQTVDASRLKSSGYIVGGSVSGSGNFGSASWRVVKPTAAAYGKDTYASLSINIGVLGATTESNISYQGFDKLESAEGLGFYAWADTVKPYAQAPSPSDGAASVPVDSLYNFELRDSLFGEGNDMGVGTGVDLAEPPGSIKANAVDQKSSTAFACSGLWGTNLCKAKIDPPPPSGIAGDKRNWEYSKTYTISISGFRDLASPNQSQLGDSPGPNTMLPKSWTFTTEADIAAPRVVAETPKRESSSAATNTKVVVDVVDLREYPGQVSGTGLDPASCSFSIWSDSLATSTYNTPLPQSIPYGYRFSITPVPFAENEWVYVLASKCRDLAGNTMADDIWRFKTADTEPPFVTDQEPAVSLAVGATGTVSFHVKDTGVGVDLGKLVVYFDGVYYKKEAGGAGIVTTLGTHITYPAALAFSTLDGTPNDYKITLELSEPKALGYAPVILVYATDLSGNIMERYASALSVGGGLCREGQSYCGPGLTWDGSFCSAVCEISSATSTPVLPPPAIILPSVSGGGSTAVEDISAAMVTQINSTSVLVTWRTASLAASRVVFDRVSVPTPESAPSYGYAQSTAENPRTQDYHSVIVSGLLPEQVYYFRPVSRGAASEFVGQEISFTIPADPINRVTQTLYDSCMANDANLNLLEGKTAPGAEMEILIY